MPRALQSISISFGLVTIPVKVYSATDAKAGIHFNMLHKCGSRVKQEYRCEEENRVVPRDELVKGYEFEEGHFVTFTKEELDALDEAASGMVEITEFVPAETIDPVFYDKTYYLGPNKGGAKPYRLLAEAMRQSGRSAIGRWAARGKQYIVTLRTVEEGLVMQTLLYSDEVRDIKEIEVPEAKVADKELQLASQLIDSITTERFDPAAYKDDVRERIQAQIQKKVEGKEITAPAAPEAPSGAKVIDIMDALRASLQKNAAGAGTGSGTKAAGPAKAVSKTASASKSAKPKERAVASNGKGRGSDDDAADAVADVESESTNAKSGTGKKTRSRKNSSRKAA